MWLNKLNLLLLEVRENKPIGELLDVSVKRMLERTYYRIWALVEWFGGGSKEAGIDSP